MQVVSHNVGTFAPIRASSKQPLTAKAVADTAPAQPLKSEPTKAPGVWENSSFSFWDIIDAINPLQHIPIISTIYQKITGDEMGYAPRIAGDTLYGGIVGNLVSSLVSAVTNVFVDSTTGKDISEHVMATLAPSKSPPQTPNRPDIQASMTIATPLRPPTSASMTQQHVAVLPPPDPSKAQAGIDQYKWQIMADEEKSRSNYWG